MQGNDCTDIMWRYFCSGLSLGKMTDLSGKCAMAGRNIRRREPTVGQTPLYAGILAEFRTNEMEILVDNHEIFADAAARAAEEAAHPEQGVSHFCRDRSPGQKDGHGRANGRTSMSGAIIFGNFGCGLCCMANIYCTLTEHTCSPWDMYEYARQVSGYAPSRKIGASVGRI